MLFSMFYLRGLNRARLVFEGRRGGGSILLALALAVEMM